MELDDLLQDFQIDNPPANWKEYDDGPFDKRSELISEWVDEGPAAMNWSHAHADFYDQIADSDPLSKLELLAGHLMGRDWLEAKAAGGDELKQLINLLHGRKFNPLILSEILLDIRTVRDRLKKYKATERALGMSEAERDQLIAEVLDDPGGGHGDEKDSDELYFSSSEPMSDAYDDDPFHSPTQSINESAVLAAVQQANSPELVPRYVDVEYPEPSTSVSYRASSCFSKSRAIWNQLWRSENDR